MIADWFISLFAGVADSVLGAMPAGRSFTVPGLDAVWNTIAGLDQLIPVIGPLTAALGLLAAGVAFVALRLVLTVWNLIYP